MTTIVAPPSNASKWQMGFNSAFKGLNTAVLISFVRSLVPFDRARRFSILNPGFTINYFRSGIKTDNLVWLITRISKFQWIKLSSLTMWKHTLQYKILSSHIRKYLTITTWSFRRNTISDEIKRNSSCSLHVIPNYLHQEIRWIRHNGLRFNCSAHTTCWRVTHGSQYTELLPPTTLQHTRSQGVKRFFQLGVKNSEMQFGEAEGHTHTDTVTV